MKKKILAALLIGALSLTAAALITPPQKPHRKMN